MTEVPDSPDQIPSEHLAKRAIVYIRRSSSEQVRQDTASKVMELIASGSVIIVPLNPTRLSRNP